MAVMKAVTSSNIAAIGYNSNEMTLFVRFHSGALYRYDGVPQADWVAFNAADSKGQHLNKSIKPRYKATLLENGANSAATQAIKNIVAFVREVCRRPALF